MRRAALILLLLAVAAPAAGAPPDRPPAQGAWIEYALQASGGAPDGSFHQATEARLLLRLQDGAWAGTCSGTTTTWDGVAEATTRFEAPAALEPPRVARGLHRGDVVDPDLTAAAPAGCRQDLGGLTVTGRLDGRTLAAAEPDGTGAYQDAALAWDARSGLVRSWSFAGSGGGFEGRVVASSGL